MSLLMDVRRWAVFYRVSKWLCRSFLSKLFLAPWIYLCCPAMFVGDTIPWDYYMDEVGLDKSSFRRGLPWRERTPIFLTALTARDVVVGLLSFIAELRGFRLTWETPINNCKGWCSFLKELLTPVFSLAVSMPLLAIGLLSF